MLTVMTPAQLLELLERRFSPLDRPPEGVELDRALGRVMARDLTASEFGPLHRGRLRPPGGGYLWMQ